MKSLGLTLALVCGLISANVVFGSLGSDVNLPGYRMSYNTYTYNTGEVSLSAFVSTTDQITDAYISFGVDSQDSSKARISINFYGLFESAVETTSTSQSLSMNRSGISISENIGLSAYKDSGNEKGFSIEPDTTDLMVQEFPLWSSGWASISLSPFVATDANSYYYEYTWEDGSRHFYQHISWQGTLGEGVSIHDLGQFAGLSVSAVPEPSLVVLVPAAILFIRRRV